MHENLSFIVRSTNSWSNRLTNWRDKQRLISTKFYYWCCAKFALLHFHVRRLSVCSHEIVSCISNRYTVWNESGLCAESQPPRLELLLVCVFKNKCAYHTKNSEQTVTISSASTIVKYYRYLTHENMLLIGANFWVQWILCFVWSTRPFLVTQ